MRSPSPASLDSLAFHQSNIITDEPTMPYCGQLARLYFSVLPVLLKGLSLFGSLLFFVCCFCFQRTLFLIFLHLFDVLRCIFFVCLLLLLFFCLCVRFVLRFPSLNFLCFFSFNFYFILAEYHYIVYIFLKIISVELVVNTKWVHFLYFSTLLLFVYFTVHFSFESVLRRIS